LIRPAAYLCDFDGTVSPSDIGAAFAARFSPAGQAESPEFLAAWRRGEMGHRELTVAQCRLLRVSEAEALAFARGFALDPDFATFVGEARARGEEVEVASEGFDFYVGDRLADAGLGDVAWSANHARFVDGGIVPEFPPVADGCGRCGNCKGSRIRALAARGFRTTLVGDGLSDRCGARAAEHVFARAGLLDWCRAEGIPALPFETFADVVRIARERAAAPIAPA